MQELDIAEMALPGPLATAYDEAVAASTEIDHFCSCTHWVLPAHAAFHADHTAFVAPLDAGFMALSRGQTSGLGRFYAALEAMWGLACPLVGERQDALGAEAALALAAQRDRWDVLWLGGIVRDGALFQALVRGLTRTAQLRLGPVTTRHQASLEGGFEGWLGRRSALFRKRIRQTLRGLERAHIELEWVDTRAVSHGLGGADGVALFQRIHAIEPRSWKGTEGTGFVGGDMLSFYREMVPRLAAGVATAGDDRALGRRGHRVHLRRDLGRHVSWSADQLRRSASASCRWATSCRPRRSRSLADDGVRTYDLGSEMEYKARWAEGGLQTVTLIAVNR